MTESLIADTAETDVFRIGTVARITGVSSHTLRKWESRYDAVAPRRGRGGERCYTREDIARLSLIKRLVDAGAAPREVVGLTNTALQQKIETLDLTERAVREVNHAPLNTAVLGSSVAAVCQRSTRVSESLSIQAMANSEQELIDRLDAQTKDAESGGVQGIDVLICECPVVTPDTHNHLAMLCDRIGARFALVVYSFSTRKQLRKVNTRRFATVRAPVDGSTLVQAARSLRDKGSGSPPAAQLECEHDLTDQLPPAPRFSREAIAAISRSSPKIRCECPHHLADIILSLRAFEEYSEGCENQSRQDAALHRYLWCTAARARAMFEDAIERVAVAEGLSLEPSRDEQKAQHQPNSTEGMQTT